MMAHSLAKCRSKLAANASAKPLDVLKIKSALQTLGHCDAPEWGLSPYPDPDMFNAIQDFQNAQGLKPDAVINPDGETEAAIGRAMTPRHTTTALQATAQALQAMGRGGDELLAHITPEEALLLDRVTDGGSINPHTGLLEFTMADMEDDDGMSGFEASGPADFDDGYSAPSGMDGGDNGGDDDDQGMTGGSVGAGTAGVQGGTDISVNEQTRKDSPKNGDQNSLNTGQSAVDNSFTSGLLDTIEEEDAPPGYDPDETIEDVEAQFEEAFGPSYSQSENTLNAPIDSKQSKGNSLVGNIIDPKALEGLIATPAIKTKKYITISHMLDPLAATAKVIQEIYNGTWTANRELQNKEAQKAARQQEKEEAKRAERQAAIAKKEAETGFSVYDPGGINFSTKQNNSYGIEASKQAAKDAAAAKAVQGVGRAISTGGSIMKDPAVGGALGLGGNLLETQGERMEREMLERDYSKYGKNSRSRR